MKAPKTIFFLAGGVCSLYLAAQPALAQTTSVTYRFTLDSPQRAFLATVPDNTPFTGTFTYNYAAPGATTPYFGGTETVFANAYTGLTMTIGADTVSETVPGPITMFNDINPPDSYSPGDSLYSFDALEAGVINPSTGTFAAYGLTPDYMFLGFVDFTGTAFSGTTLPTTLSLSEFSQDEAFIEVFYGPQGPGLMGNSFTLTSLTPVPEPGSGLLVISGLAALLTRRIFPRSSSRARNDNT